MKSLTKYIYEIYIKQNVYWGNFMGNFLYYFMSFVAHCITKTRKKTQILFQFYVDLIREITSSILFWTGYVVVVVVLFAMWFV